MNKPKIISFVLAGGSGTRLAPLSLSAPGKLPKQFLPLLSDKTMLQETLDRLPENVEKVVICAEKYEDEVRKQVGKNVGVISEPFPCNTAMAIGLGAIWAKKMSGDENTIIFFNPSDHHVNTGYFRKYYKQMIDAATPGKIVTMGITPDRPETGLGYIKIKPTPTSNVGESPTLDVGVVEIETFVEKPNLEKALEFVKSGEYFWNSGMFCFTIKTILEKLERHAPVIYGSLLEIEKATADGEVKKAIFDGFTRVKEQKANISIDFAVMEKEAENILLVKAEKELEWDDIGLWISLKRYFPADEKGNVIKGAVKIQDSSNNLALNYLDSRTIVLNSLNDILVVNTENGVLVCPQSSAIRASEIVPHLENNEKEILIDCEDIEIKNETKTPIACIGCGRLEITCSEERVEIS